MKILFISQYFPPEMGAPASRTYDLAKQWVRAGHEVTVLTAFPHHPTGVIPDGYRGKLFMREEVDGIQVVRSFVYAVPNQGFMKRTLSYISFMLSAILFSPFVKDRSEVVIATSPQFFVAIAGYCISRLRRRPFVFEVRDLWPESIVAVGALTNKSIIKVLTKIEYFLYQRATRIIGVAESTRKILPAGGISRQKIEIIPNGIDLERFAHPESLIDDVWATGFPKDKFVISYIGTHGMAHGLECILATAQQLLDVPDIHFVFIGEGAEKDALVAQKAKLGLSNVTFLSQQDRNLIPAFLSASDVSLVHLRDAPLFANVLPSKMFEIMAVGCPIILGVRGEAKALLEKAEAGLSIDPENAEQLKDAILTLKKNPEHAKVMGNNGREFVNKHYSREKLAKQYIDILQDMLV